MISGLLLSCSTATRPASQPPDVHPQTDGQKTTTRCQYQPPYPCPWTSAPVRLQSSQAAFKIHPILGYGYLCGAPLLRWYDLDCLPQNVHGLLHHLVE